MPVKSIEREIQGHDTTRFKDRDRQYMDSPKYDQIVVKKLDRVPFDFFIYIVDVNATREEIGLASNSAREFSLFYQMSSQRDYEKLTDMIGTKKVNMVRNNPKAVHMLITHNDPDSIHWMPLTPWMILHRLAHACLDANQMGAKNLDSVINARQGLNDLFDNLSDLESLLEEKYPAEQLFSEKIINLIMPFKSAQRSIPDHYEIKLELFVFYLWNGGHLKFKQTRYPEINAYAVNMKRVLEPLFAEVAQEIKGVMWTG